MEEAQEQSLVNQDRAQQVLQEIDLLIIWKNKVEKEVEKKMMHLCLNLLESHRNRYWKIRGFEDESQYIASVFPHSRRYYYRLIEIGETLGHYDHKVLEEIGPSKCTDLVKVHKRFGAVPQNYFAHAIEEDRDTFHARVQAAISDDCTNGRVERQEVVFETLSFVGDQYFDYTEALRIVQMETGIEKKTEAFCMILRDFLSGYRDDGRGRIQDKNAFIMGVIKRCYQQIDRGKPDIYKRLIAQLGTWIEEGRDAGPYMEAEACEVAEG